MADTTDKIQAALTKIQRGSFIAGYIAHAEDARQTHQRSPFDSIELRVLEQNAGLAYAKYMELARQQEEGTG